MFRRRTAPAPQAAPVAQRRGLAPEPPNLEAARFVVEESVRVEGDEHRPDAERIRSAHISGPRIDAHTPLLGTGYIGSVVTDVHPRRDRVAFLAYSGGDDGPLYIPDRYEEPVPASTLPGFTILPTKGHSACGVSWSPNGSALAVIEWHGFGLLVTLDLHTGTRTVIADLGLIAGNEEAQWSPDGAWILIAQRPRPLLVSIETHRVIELPVDNVDFDWWPTGGPSMLIGLRGEPTHQHLVSYDLAANRLSDLGEVDFPVQSDLAVWRQGLFDPRVSPRGDQLLVGCNLGPGGEYQERHASRQRVWMLEIATRRATPFSAPFLDDARTIEREQDRWRWIPTPRIAIPVEVSDRLLRPAASVAPSGSQVDAVSDNAVLLWSWG